MGEEFCFTCGGEMSHLQCSRLTTVLLPADIVLAFVLSRVVFVIVF